MTDDIKKRLEEHPYVPFTVYVTDGREFYVPTVDHVHVHPGGMRVSVWTNDNLEHVIPIRQLSGLSAEFLDPSEPTV